MNDQIEVSPPKKFGICLAIYGGLLAAIGVYLISIGDNLYFFLIGFGILVSGLLISRGKLYGAYIYALTLAVIITWSIIEVRAGMGGSLISRIGMPIIIGLYLFIKIRPRLIF